MDDNNLSDLENDVDMMGAGGFNEDEDIEELPHDH